MGKQVNNVFAERVDKPETLRSRLQRDDSKQLLEDVVHDSLTLLKQPKFAAVFLSNEEMRQELSETLSQAK